MPPISPQRQTCTFSLVCLLFLIQGISTTSGSPVCAQPPSEQVLGFRKPPPRSIVPMRKSISLGKDQGHRARVRGIEITDEQFNPFLVQLIISGDKSLGIYQATFTTDQGSFHTELPRERRPRVRLRLNNAPNSPSSTFSAEHREEHTFNISNDDAVAIMNSNTLAVTFTGRMQQRSYTFKQKHLAEFKKWLGPLVKKYVPGEDPK